MSQPGIHVSHARSSCGAPGVEAMRVRSRAFGRLAAACVGLALSTLGAMRSTGEPHHDAPAAASVESTNQKPQFAVTINRAPGPRLIATGLTNFQGQAVMATCSFCHTTTKPNPETRATEDLRQFHQGLKYRHGNLTCLSCHNAGDYERLRLADGRAVDFPDSMTLCSQCHGPQRRDYNQGLHGGMNGHWDLTRGGRTRNTCINCHDPHSPAFPTVLPVLSPRDRISVPGHPAAETAPHSASHP